MELCSGGRPRHDEIVHNERKCPLCEALEEIADLKGKIEDLEVDIEALQKGE